ncbi:MAG: cupin domain-containing protein [candidate division KSB1 bacterium]|nr:cupin domain-containing protein [candidate division KSB1 bacterium]
MQKFIKGATVMVEELGQGVSRKILGHDSDLMLVKVYFEKDAVGAPHQHPHQQVSHVLEGEFEVAIEGEKEILRQGDGFVVPSNARHGVVCREKGILLDAFSPMRTDFIKG